MNSNHAFPKMWSISIYLLTAFSAANASAHPYSIDIFPERVFFENAPDENFFLIDMNRNGTYGPEDDELVSNSAEFDKRDAKISYAAAGDTYRIVFKNVGLSWANLGYKWSKTSVAFRDEAGEWKSLALDSAESNPQQIVYLLPLSGDVTAKLKLAVQGVFEHPTQNGTGMISHSIPASDGLFEVQVLAKQRTALDFKYDPNEQNTFLSPQPTRKLRNGDTLEIRYDWRRISAQEGCRSAEIGLNFEYVDKNGQHIFSVFNGLDRERDDGRVYKLLSVVPEGAAALVAYGVGRVYDGIRNSHELLKTCYDSNDGKNFVFPVLEFSH